MRYQESNAVYIQFYKENGQYCLGSEGYLVFYPDRRKSLTNTRLEIGELAHNHISNMRRLGRDISNEKFELLNRYQWTQLK